MVKALAIYKDESGCDYHRIRLPFRYAGDRVDNSAFFGAESLGVLLQRAELIIWNRQYPYDLQQLIDVRRATGLKLVVDLDDYWMLNPGHYLYSTWSRQNIPQQLIELMKMADAVTVTTSRLAAEVKRINKNVHVIPNALPYGHGQFVAEKKPENQSFTFLYAGGQSHLPDLTLIQGPLKRIASERRSDIRFALAGYHLADKTGIWDKMEYIMSAGGQMPCYSRIPNRPLDSYMQGYKYADAVLVPLQQNTFTPFKSNLKLLEAAAAKLPAICQRVPPYSDCDAPVLWVDKTADWYKSIKYLATNPGFATELGEKLHEWAVREYNLFAWNKYRFDLYEHIANC